MDPGPAAVAAAVADPGPEAVTDREPAAADLVQAAAVVRGPAVAVAAVAVPEGPVPAVQVPAAADPVQAAMGAEEIHRNWKCG